MGIAGPFQMPVSRIYLLGDSLALPRHASTEGHAIAYEETYPYLLRKRLVELEHEQQRSIELLVNAQRARTMPDAATFWREIALYRPTIAIVQLGIVDSAPRIFSPLQGQIVAKIRPRSLSKAILNFVSRHRRRIISTLPLKVYVPLPEFRAAARKIAAACVESKTHLAFVAIAPPNTRMAFRSPGIEHNVTLYNAALQQVASEHGATFVDLYTAIASASPDEYMLEDGHHLDVPGHLALTSLLWPWLEDLLTRQPVTELQDA